MSRRDALKRLAQRKTYTHEGEMVRVVAELLKGVPTREVFEHSQIKDVDAQIEACKRAETVRNLRLL